MATRVRMHWAHAPGPEAGGLATLPSGALTLTSGADGAILAHHTDASGGRPWWRASDGDGDGSGSGGRGAGGGEPPAVELSAASAAHAKPITTLAVHPAGTLLATGDEDSYVRLFTLPPLPAGATAGAGSSASGSPGELGGWGDAVSLLAAPARFGRPVRALAFSPTGSLLAAAGEEPGVLKLIATADPTSQVSILRGSVGSRADEPIAALAFDPLGDYVVSVGTRGGVGVWGVDAGGLVAEADVAAKLISPTCVAWTPDGSKVLVGGDAGAVVVAREAWGVIRELEGGHDEADDEDEGDSGGVGATPAPGSSGGGAPPRRGVTAISVSPAGGYVATGDAAGVVVVWNLGTAEVVDRWRLEAGAVRQIVWHPAAAALIVLDDGGHWAVIGDILPDHMPRSYDPTPSPAVALVAAAAEGTGGGGRGRAGVGRPRGRLVPTAAQEAGDDGGNGGWGDARVDADGNTLDDAGGGGDDDDDGEEDAVHRPGGKKRRPPPAAAGGNDEDDGGSDAGSGGGSEHGNASDVDGGGSGSDAGGGGGDSDDGASTIGSGSGGESDDSAAAAARRRIERALAAEADAADDESDAPARSDGGGGRGGGGGPRGARGRDGRGGRDSNGGGGGGGGGRGDRHKAGGSGRRRGGGRSRGRGGGAFRAQPPFMPSSTPWDTVDAAGTPLPDASRILCWSLLGTITSTAAATHASVAIDFADGDRRPVSFTDHYGYTHGSLGELGALFAAPASTVHAATVFFRPFASWAANADWTLPLPPGEAPAAVALGARFAAVATTAGLLRVLSLTGVQTDVCRLAGSPVTLAAAGERLLVVTALGGVLHYTLLGVAAGSGEVNTEYGGGALPLTPKAALTWAGFSADERQRVAVYDSAGSLTVLADCRRRGVCGGGDDGGGAVRPPGHHWVPLIMDAAAAAGCEYLWPVGLSGDELIGTACYGGRSAPRVTPRPPLQPVPLGAPVIDATASRATERLFRSRLTAGDAVAAHAAAVATADVGAGAGEPPLEEDEDAVEAAEKALADANVAVDKCLLKLVEEAAVAGKGARALDYASRLSLHKSHEFASVVANHYKLPALAARIARLAAVKDFGEDAGLTAGAARRRAVVRPVVMAAASPPCPGAAAASAAAAAAAPPPPPRVGVVDDEDEDAPVGVRRILPRAPTAAVPAPAAGDAAANGDGAGSTSDVTAPGEGDGAKAATADDMQSGDEDDAAVDDDAEMDSLMPKSRKRPAPPTVLAMLRAAPAGSKAAAAKRKAPLAATAAVDTDGKGGDGGGGGGAAADADADGAAAASDDEITPVAAPKKKARTAAGAKPRRGSVAAKKASAAAAGGTSTRAPARNPFAVKPGGGKKGGGGAKAGGAKASGSTSASLFAVLAKGKTST